MRGDAGPRQASSAHAQQRLPRPVPHGWCYLPSLSASDLRGRLVAIENVAQYLPLTVHTRPHLHELPCVLDALPLSILSTARLADSGRTTAYVRDRLAELRA